jgi:NADPH:quinone reductase-like Zn-dependent oxidoreductase
MSSDGVLAELVAVPESGLVEVPDSLSYEEASSLTCVGTTAWNALFEIGRLKAGDSVLLQGTGGLSITALQLARAAGIRVIITSSSDEKLERARNLGADGTINYIKTPEWQDEALRLTDGQGVDLVLEVGGEGTLERSIAATKLEGTVAITGGLTGMGNAPLNLFATIVGLKHLVGVWVGSAEMLKNALRVYDTGIRPVVDHVFDFSQARSAYEHLLAGKHFGKVVIRVG